MLLFRRRYIASLLSLALMTCSKALPNVTAARNTMGGMNTEQITACMGRPGTVLTQDNTTVWSYNTLNSAAGAPRS
jgi:hypothetical protein